MNWSNNFHKYQKYCGNVIFPKENRQFYSYFLLISTVREVYSAGSQVFALYRTDAHAKSANDGQRTNLPLELVPSVVVHWSIHLCYLLISTGSPHEIHGYPQPVLELVATILSAQSTDKQVNKVTKKLFEKYPDAQAIAQTRMPTALVLLQFCQNCQGIFRHEHFSMLLKEGSCNMHKQEMFADSM